MLRLLILVILLSLLSACSLFQSKQLKVESPSQLLSSISLVGEGRGRLGIESHQYLFSYDSILKDNSDWLLAANIPLHGEEILQFSSLQQEHFEDESRDPFEIRIEQGIAQYLRTNKKSPQLAGVFIRELRSLIRFLLAKELGLKVDCRPAGDDEICQLGTSRYQLKNLVSKLSLKKKIDETFIIEYVAQNLTTSIFRRGSVYLSSRNHRGKYEPLLSLELFWK